MMSPNTLPNGRGWRSSARARSGVSDAKARQMGLHCLILQASRKATMGL
jgi:hypothetical protein